ncbi:exocyst complex component EXO70B1-like [Asparagus officinalis]|uniref:exocyst complex component EXO70B1-like n=1 Tax=Asparagus officinalis TaxID=4686 RepID=UPI00098E048E|nr:exocyst complex component EXO70B1-like [Asparagus officinalis]
MGAEGDASEERGLGCTEERLGILHEMIVNWDSDQSMIWDRDPEEAALFLRIVDEVRLFTENLGEEQKEILCHAHSTLQSAMSRLEDEFIHLLVQYRQPLEPDHMSFRSTEDELVDDFSSSSFDEEPIQGKIRTESSRGSEEFVIDLIHPDAVFELRTIAELMFLSKYDKECCQAFIAVRREALDDCLSILRVERLSIEEVIQLDWTALNTLIKRWNRALKVFIRVYLASERRLSDLIFGECSESVGDYCFLESSKGSILRFLNLGEAIAIGPVEIEKLFRILDMYEGLQDLLADVESLYSGDSGSLILMECHEVLLRLSKFIIGIFTEFKNAIRKKTSNTPFPGGGVHHLTKYVMNYMRTLADYSGTLNLLLNDEDEKDCPNSSAPMMHHLQSIVLILEANLEARSMLYTDTALQHLYMMNNLCYIVQKVKNSDLRSILGDDWIRAYSRKFRQHAMNYERASWISVLSFLKDEGICSHGSSSPSRTVLKERFRGFNLAFEEVYRAQTGWNIPNIELRDDLKISISLKVLQAYRTFMGRYASHLDGVRHRDSYIKYCPEDLERCLLDLFEGTSRVMHTHRR